MTLLALSVSRNQESNTVLYAVLFLPSGKDYSCSPVPYWKKMIWMFCFQDFKASLITMHNKRKQANKTGVKLRWQGILTTLFQWIIQFLLERSFSHLQSLSQFKRVNKLVAVWKSLSKPLCTWKLFVTLTQKFVCQNSVALHYGEASQQVLKQIHGVGISQSSNQYLERLFYLN